MSSINPGVALAGTDCILRYRWIAGKISDILGNEDDVVIELCFNLIEGSRFVCELWALYPPNTNTIYSRISKKCKSNSQGFLTKTRQASAKNYGSFV